MKNPKLIWNLINLLNGVLILLYLFKVMHWTSILNSIQIFHILIAAAVVYGLRSWFEIKFNVSNQIKNNQVTKIVYYVGGGIFILGILFKTMHWPFGNILYLIGVVTVVLSFIISFFVNSDSNVESNPNILDDI